MAQRKRALGKLLTNNFADATREEMREAYAQKFQRPLENDESITDESLRQMLAAAFTQPVVPTAQAPHQDVIPPPRILPARDPAMRTKIPQLNPSGRWDGRMRRCTFRQRHGSPNQQCESVGWNGLVWNILLDTPVDMPWPYYLAALNTLMKDEGSLEVSDWVKQKDKRLMKVVTPRYIKTVNFDDHGDVPGTENLPIDYVDYFQREAERTRVFSKYGRPALVMIHNILHEQLPMTFFRDMSDADIRMAIAVRLGTHYEQILQDEFYEEAQSA